MAKLHLQPGEVVVIEKRPSPVAWPLLWYLCTLGFSEIWRRRRRFIITGQRVIVARGLIRRSIRFVPLDRVQDVTMANILWRAAVQLSSAGGPSGVERLHPLRTRDARALVSELTLRTGRGHGLAASTTVISVADELEKLAALHERGVLTDTEFQSQKASRT